MEIDTIWNMALEIVQKGLSHIDDANRRMVHERDQSRCLDEPWEVHVFKRRGLGIQEGGEKEKIKGE
jgi:hypothetical protein